jgi:sigma-B regulation protein RsbQ
MDANWAECVSLASHQTFDDPALAAEMERVAMGNDPSMGRVFALATFTADERPLLSKLEIPCLLVPCTRDAFIPLSAAEYMRDRLPRAEYRPLHAAGHCPQMTHAPQVETLIREFLPS